MKMSQGFTFNLVVKISLSIILLFSAMGFYSPENNVRLINELDMTYGEFSLCSKLDKKLFIGKGYSYVKSKYVKPRYGSRINEEFYNKSEGLVFDYDDGILQRIYIFFPRQDTTLKGIHTGSLRSDVLKAYGQPQWNAGNDLIGYDNVGFMFSGDLVYGIRLSDHSGGCDE